MMQQTKQILKSVGGSIIYSYSQIFFAKNIFLGIILLAVSFMDWWMGIAGLVSVLTANVLAYVIGFSEKYIKDGIYAFNSLLVGLGIGLYFTASFNALLLIVFASAMTLFIAVVLQGVMTKYALPFLSLPFLFSIWLLTISFSQFSNLGLSLKDIYTANELYSVGGLKLVRFFDWINSIHYPPGLKIYFISLGAIFFQFNVVAGILIALGLFIHSRQAFLMSLLGFYTAYFFFGLLGIDSASFSVSYYGFNFILAAIALGSYFLVPNVSSLLLMLLSVPVLSLITVGTDLLFSKFGLPVYSLPFNIVVLSVIYALKLRQRNLLSLTETPFQLKNPETNAYFFRNKKEKFLASYSLPVMGKWSVNQGFNGKYTHKDAWQYAWDFVITDNENKQYTNRGDYVTDYYCYNKPVVAVADGTVVEIIDGVEDNIIGTVNTKQNWGNTIVIWHGYGVYSQYSHLRKGSIKTAKGVFVKKGQIIANVGNTGRSPYPHLHFQFQATNIVGSKTIKLPFSNYFVHTGNKTKFVHSGFPAENSIVSKLEPQPFFVKMLNFVPGDVIDAVIIDKSEKKLTILADIDMMNNTFLKSDKSFMYFSNDKTIFKSLNFSGKKGSFLHLFFNTMYFVPLGIHKNVEFLETVPLFHNHSGILRFLQDFFVNFKFFIKTNYKLTFAGNGDSLNPSEIKFKVELRNTIFNKTISVDVANVTLSSVDYSVIEYTKNNKKIILKWKKRVLSY